MKFLTKSRIIVHRILIMIQRKGQLGLSTNKSLERCLILINKLADYPKGLGITELSHHLDIPTTTVHRIVSTLLNFNMVKKDINTGKVLLGMHMVYLASKIIDSIDLRESARPYLEDLRDKTNEVIHLCVRENEEVVYIDKVESNQKVKIASKIGYRANLHCTGVGKALLTGLEDEEVRKILKNKGMTKYTETTIIDPEQMIKHLHEIKNKGYAIDNLEHEADIRCVAAPILDYTNKVIAAISIAGPETRVTNQKIEQELAPLIKETALSISKSLGYIK
ncbi:IclR family transcriptional regulator [Halobacillus salinarum]|uniref:IclR family transcriptional regulator n=1 Tax=Halobacillus salinarum TaxID=2932257 RepID=A0ABY4EIG8_9BACI|nr:IclR family transcriptional regulator [Halobacillus salinarum]UOQ44286.1 IclR family transcriptional regulator [Halobacillus salinarum]